MNIWYEKFPKYYDGEKNLQLARDQDCEGRKSSNELAVLRIPCVELVGVNLSEPHTSVTALQDACTCMSGTYVCTYVRPYTENLN